VDFSGQTVMVVRTIAKLSERMVRFRLCIAVAASLPSTIAGVRRHSCGRSPDHCGQRYVTALGSQMANRSRIVRISRPGGDPPEAVVRARGRCFRGRNRSTEMAWPLRARGTRGTDRSVEA
jgi:hypothetical protein